MGLVWLALLPPAQGHSQPPESGSRPIHLLVNDGSFVALDEEANLIVVSRDHNHVSRYLANQGYDSVVTFGGTAFGRDGLNGPLEVSVPNRQSIYLLDAGNRRILLLNPNMRMVREMDFRTTDFAENGEPGLFLNPAHITATATGELFVLNQDDNQVFKINRFGQRELVFGGTAYGDGTLLGPARIIADAQQRFWVLDTIKRQLLLFDLSGTYRRAYPFPNNTNCVDVDIQADFILWTTPTGPILQHLPTGQVQVLTYNHAAILLQARMGRPGEFLVLTSGNELNSYSITAPR